MKYYILGCFCWLLGALQPSQAQPTYAPNETDPNGQKTGYWVHKDAEGRIISRGRYVEGRRDGEWRFHMFPVSRRGDAPDIIGHYINGVKTGEWQATHPTEKFILKGSFTDDQMSGRWTYYNSNGSRLAEGAFNNGIRDGIWVFYRGNQIMSAGNYSNGLKTGLWRSDYYTEDSSTHIVGAYDYSNGQQNGQFQHYKVVRHKKFPTTEALVGTGSYLNGKKTGRWIEYDGGERGEKVETGVYDGDGTRTGPWDVSINGQKYEELSYANGNRQGGYIAYFDNGNPRYISSFEQDFESGSFTAYFPSKVMKEKGSYTIYEKGDRIDTQFYKINLPFELALRLVDIEFENYNLNAINWVKNVDISIDGNELNNRYTEFLSYGSSKTLRVEKINRQNRLSVRVGDYKAFYENGKVKIEGRYHPSIYTTKIGELNYMDFARDGIWKEYNESGDLTRQFLFDKGELKTVTDGLGDPLPLEENRLK